MRSIIVIAHDIRSTHNVGSLLRTCEGLGVVKVYLSGYTPYPQMMGDKRLPHLSRKISSAIHKTALGAENSLTWEHTENIISLLSKLKADGFTIAALEQTSAAQNLHECDTPQKIAVLLGNEAIGLPEALLNLVPLHLQIPMAGKKESFNVVQAAAMALYQLRFH